ncbi:MAG: hypothetical protein EOP48_17930 [Sphingobacteriales bacterium]|nr:MAG: hypothetical protein EOP48_17930 [Sphingobacteriales bacterium]
MQSAKPTNSSKPPYLLGLLGFIPLVGAFVGVALILYGIFRYKDKWLVLVGVLGILFTFGAYATLTAVGKNIMKPGSMEIAMSKKQLVAVVKSVEFYKLQFGQYPDSLQQMPKDQFTPIFDFTQSASNGQSIPFYYEKVGDRYWLCSKGLDKILGTEDDLYPLFFMADSSKFGLIRKNESLGQ